MKLISKLKGYYRRLTTMKKDKKYKPELNTYGDISVEFIDSIMINEASYSSNTVIALHYNDQSDSINDLNDLKNLIIQSDLRVLDLKFDFVAYVYGQSPSYATFLFNNENQKSYNKFFSLLYNLCTEIDIIDETLQYVKDPEANAYYTKKYYPYETESIDLSTSMPIYVQDVTAKLPENIRSKCKGINALFMYNYNGQYNYTYMKYVSDLKVSSILQSKDGDDLLKYEAPEWTKQYASNLTIYDGTNILEDNLLITNNDDQALYDDIDEIIE